LLDVVAELDRHDRGRIIEPDDQIEIVVAEPAAVRLALVDGFAQHWNRDQRAKLSIR
jgi:hypothetical protein